jgi:hypothetical protein
MLRFREIVEPAASLVADQFDPSTGHRGPGATPACPPDPTASNGARLERDRSCAGAETVRKVPVGDAEHARRTTVDSTAGMRTERRIRAHPDHRGRGVHVRASEVGCTERRAAVTVLPGSSGAYRHPFGGGVRAPFDTLWPCSERLMQLRGGPYSES